MAESKSVNVGAILFTDSYQVSVNGISVFTRFFVTDYMQQHFSKVWVYETSTDSLYDTTAENENTMITHLYVNANFSASDYFVRSTSILDLLQQHGLVIADNPRKIMVSHGWPRIRFRFTYYNLYYTIRNFSRAKDFARLSFYDEMLFISRAVDAYRHEDHQYCLQHGKPLQYYDFYDRFLDRTGKMVPQKVGPAHEIMVVANFQKVKNLWWLVRYNMMRRVSGKKMKHFCLLIYPQKSTAYRLFAFLAGKFSVRLEHDQQKKAFLLQQSAYLFIPSFTEYTPLVALEAFSNSCKVVSLYQITALKAQHNYHAVGR